MSGSAIKAGRAFVELVLDDDKLQAGLFRAQKTLTGAASAMQGVGLKMAGVGVAIVVGLAAAVMMFADVGSALNDMSARTGLTVEMLSRLDHAAGMAGASLEDVEVGAKTFSKLIAAAKEGSKGAIQTLKDMGLTVADVAELSQDKRFMVFAERISRIEDPALRASMALEVFGKAGTKLLPLLDQNAEALKALMNEAEEFGLVMSTQAAERADTFGDALDLLKKLLRQTALEVGNAVIPMFLEWVKMAQQVVKIINTWIKENPELVQTLLKVGVALAVVGGAILAVGVAAQALAFIFAGVGMAISAAIFIIKAPFIILGGLIAALSSPLGALLVGVGAVVAGFLYMTGLGGAAIQWLRDRFDDLAETFGATWKGITDAIKAGDLALAMEIAWLGIKIAWNQGCLWILKIWNSLKLSILSVWNDAMASIKTLGSDATVGLMVMWLEFSTFIEKLWNDITTGFMNKWDEAIGWVEKKLHKIVMGGVWSDDQMAEAMKMVDDRVGAETKKRTQEKDTANKALETEKNKQIGEAGQIANANRDAFSKDATDANKALEADYAKREQAARAEIEDLRNQLKGLANLAGDKAKNKKSPKFDFSSGVDAETKNLAKTDITTMGTFSSEALFGFGVMTTAQERTAKATEETAKNTKEIVKFGNDNQGGAFV